MRASCAAWMAFLRLLPRISQTLTGPADLRSAQVRAHSTVTDLRSQGSLRVASFAFDSYSPPAAECLITLIFVTICLDGTEKAVLASPATMALVPRFLTRRWLVTFKSRLLVSDRSLEQQGCSST